MTSMNRLIAALAVLLPATMFAQMPFGIDSRTMMVAKPEVKKEVKVTKEQEKKVQALIAEFQTNAQAGNMSGFNMMNPLGSIDPKLVDVFDETQQARIEELFLQSNDGFALTDDKVAATMAVTEDQRKVIKSESQAGFTTLIGMMQKARSKGDFNKLKAERKRLAEQLKAHLTPEQAAKFEELKGKPFKFKD